MCAHYPKPLKNNGFIGTPICNTGRGRNQDRDRVAGGQEYEVEYFAHKHGITVEQARQLIKEHGNNRETLDREAEKLKRKAG